MLTTKVVSNKKPPLLSDSESGGSTSLFNMPIPTAEKRKDFYNFMINKFGYDYIYTLLMYYKLPANEIISVIKEKEMKEGYK